MKRCEIRFNVSSNAFIKCILAAIKAAAQTFNNVTKKKTQKQVMKSETAGRVMPVRGDLQLEILTYLTHPPPRGEERSHSM